MLVEYFFVEGVVEVFDVGILVGFVGLDVLDGYVVGFGLLGKCFV